MRHTQLTCFRNINCSVDDSLVFDMKAWLLKSWQHIYIEEHILRTFYKECIFSGYWEHVDIVRKTGFHIAFQSCGGEAAPESGDILYGKVSLCWGNTLHSTTSRTLTTSDIINNIKIIITFFVTGTWHQRASSQTQQSEDSLSTYHIKIIWVISKYTGCHVSCDVHHVGTDETRVTCQVHVSPVPLHH